MAMTYATIGGRVTQPGTDLGIRARVTATAMTTANALKFTTEDRITWGPQTAETNATGVLGTLKVPTNHGIPSLFWKLTVEPLDRIPGLPKKWDLGLFEITADTRLEDLVQIDVTVVSGDVLVSVADMLADTLAAKNAAAASQTAAAGSASTAAGWATAAASSAADADSSADLAAASETNAATSAATATTKASQAATSATDAAASATHAEEMAGAAEAVAVSDDTIIAGRINDSSSATAAALSASIGERVEVEATATGPNTILKGHSSNAIASDIERSVILGGGTTGYNNVIGGDGANVNTTTPNTTTTGTGAHVSVVGGYDNSAGALSSKIISDHAKTVPGSQGHNGIYGGAGGVAGANAGFCFLTGRNPTADALYAVVGGSDNEATGDASVAFGANNDATGDYSNVSGSTNVVSGTYARAHGSNLTASGTYSTAEGRYAVARRYGQHAFASGRVAADGDVQTSFHTAYGVTSNNTPQTLGVEGGTTYNSNHQMLRGQTVLVEAKVVGRSADGSINAGFVLTGLAHFEDAGNASMLGGIEKRTIYNPSGLDATIIAALSVGQLAVQVTGHASTPITWSAKLDLVEVLA